MMMTDSDREKAYLYWICQLPSMGAVTIRKLYEHFESFESIYNIEEKRLRACGFLKNRQADEIIEWKGHIQKCMEDYMHLGERGIQFVTPLDAEYPGRLREIYDYPMGIYVRGRLTDSDRPAVAIVGARGCSAYGEQLAFEFGRALASEKVQIVSGLAMGIDSAAHRGALEAGADTYAVLGCGVNICYPAVNYNLCTRMMERGGVLSEFAVGVPPLRRNFPMRNRIISGLCDAVLVVEAKEHSGSLITAGVALEQGREVFAIPGRITDRLSGGCNGLIEQGARMALSPSDILEFLGLKYEKMLVIHEKNTNGLANKEKMVYSCLDFKPKHLDEIMGGCGLSVSECMGILLELELGGYVFRSGNQYYGKKL